MTHRQLAGLTFVAHSPSLYEFHGALVGYDGRWWRLGALGCWGAAGYQTAQAAAAALLSHYLETTQQAAE